LNDLVFCIAVIHGNAGKVSCWPIARVWRHTRKRPVESMEVRRRSAMRNLSAKAVTGHDLPVAKHPATGSFMLHCGHSPAGSLGRQITLHPVRAEWQETALTGPSVSVRQTMGRYRPRADPGHSLQNWLVSLMLLPGFVIDEFTFMNNT